MTLDLDAMTWTCNVCCAVRPDAMIAVAKRPGPIPAAVWNIRYCVDRPACVEYATASGQWIEAAEWWRVDVPVGPVDIEDLDLMEQITQAIPYDTMWTSVEGVDLAVVHLAATDAEAAARHAIDSLARSAVTVDRDAPATTSPARR